VTQVPPCATVRYSLRAFLRVTLLGLAFFLGGCAPHRHPVSQIPAPPPPPMAAPPVRPIAPPPVTPGSYVEEGLASWYGVPYHGRRAADGEIYDMYKMTAAHRTLPFDSVVRVINLKNGRTTEVRINDRGPFVEKRVIDLSLAAARALDMVAAGVAPVRLELLAGNNPREGSFTVQVGAFQVQENAERVRARLEQRYQPVVVRAFDSPNGLFYRVWVGRAPSQEAARQLASRLAAEEGVTPFVVRFDP
jgi:rare lipoprotein A